MTKKSISFFFEKLSFLRGRPLLNDETTNDIMLIIRIVQLNQLMILNLVLLMDILMLGQLQIETWQNPFYVLKQSRDKK
jgi:hypothetical protein